MTQIPGLFTRSRSSDARGSNSLLSILGALGPAPAGAPSRPGPRRAGGTPAAAPRTPLAERLAADRAGRAGAGPCGEALR